MTELEIEELKRNIDESDSCKEEERRADNTGINLGEVIILTAQEAEEEIGYLEEEEVAIIEQIPDVLVRIQKLKLPARRDVPEKKLLEETPEVDKVVCKFKTNITKTSELFYAGAVVVTNRLGVTINKAAERKEAMWKRLQNKSVSQT